MKITALLVLFGFTASEFNEVQWEGENQLNWDDFTTVANGRDIHDAVTATGISFSYTEHEEYIDVHVVAVFDRNESWVRPGAMTAELLAHEQLHFNITEMYARILRQTLTDNSLYSVQDLDTLYDNTMKELIDLQEAYDRETHHGLDREKQYEWERWVSSQVREHEFFSQQSIAIGLPMLAQN